MPFPTTRRQLEVHGYQWLNNGTCSGCGAAIRFYKTPKGKRIPMDEMSQDESPAVSHFATCPKGEQFRKGKK